MKRLSLLSLFLMMVMLWNGCKTKKEVVMYDNDSSIIYSDASDSYTPVGVAFTESPKLGGILEQAAAENKLVFVDFYTTWCTPCKLMDKDVFPHEDLGNFMNDNFISYKVNAEEGNGLNLRTLYNVQVYPTLIFLDARGREVIRKEGAAYHRELKNLGRKAMALAKRMPEVEG